MRLIERSFYLDKLADAQGTPDIKVVTGVRRSGKSTLMEAFATHVKERDPGANIIEVNFNLLGNEHLREYHALHDHIEAAYMPGTSNYVFIDEVQMCDGFEQTVNSLHASGKYDIYITGSNAFMLSSDLATLFTGRTFEVEVFPFSLLEFMDYFGLDNVDTAFERYLFEGGMAGSYPYHNASDKYSYIADVFDTLIIRDIRQKHGIRNEDVLVALDDFLLDNISNITSSRSIANALASGGRKVNDRTIGAYLSYLKEAFAFYRVRRFDLHGKRCLSSGAKYYLCDHSFKYAKLGTRNIDYGRAYENMVAIDLLRRGYEVYAGVLYKTEIDFVAIRQSEKLYIQVSDDIFAPATLERETAPLLKIRDAYPKLLVARTRHDMYTLEGIEIHDIARWLAR